MRIALVTCFNADWRYGRVPSPYIPLNLLGLAAALEQRGHEVAIVDQTLALVRGEARDDGAFHERIADLIAAAAPDVVGFTTMCNSFPQTLTLARIYRRRAPEARIVLGGPQATAVDRATLHHFPWIDVVVRGEADATFPELVDRWADGRSLDRDVRGVTWRAPDGAVQRNDDAPLVDDLDELPFPAYHLYPIERVDVPLLPIEAGRGCPYGCTFCSTNLFFSRRYRIKSPERLVDEMTHLAERYDRTGFDLVHDMLTVDRRWMARFCRVLGERDRAFQWGCSARVDRVDPELLAAMAEAGCIGIFFGIETGSQRLQPVIKKKLHTAHVLPTMRTCVDHGMAPTASFITGFPDETVGDALASLHMALDVLEVSPRTRAQMHLLAPLVGSPLFEAHRDDLRFDGHSSDISLFLLTDAEVEAVETYPDVFPNFYYIPTPHMDRNLTKAVSASLYTCPVLLIALRHAGVDLEGLLEGWVAWLARSTDGQELDQDYYLYRFGLDFCRYLRHALRDTTFASAPHLAEMIDYFETKYALQRGHVAERILFRQFEYDVPRLNEMARADAWTSTIPSVPTSLLLVNLTAAPERGFAYLEVPVPSEPDPVVKAGDRLEIPELHRQLRTLPKLAILNVTQHRWIVVRHHLTPTDVQALGLDGAAPPPSARSPPPLRGG